MTEIARLSPYMLSKYPDSEALMVADPKGQYTFADAADALKLENTMLKQRLAEMGEKEIDLHAKVIQLESDLQGPDGFKTWQEAATAERIRRINVEKELATLQQDYDERDEEACELIERWLDVGQPHDWDGWQKRVEKFLGFHVEFPEPIPPGITWRSEQGNFYDGYNRGQGEEFLVKWYDRRQEFPKLHDNLGRP